MNDPSQWTRREISCEADTDSTDVCFLFKLGRHVIHGKPSVLIFEVTVQR